MFFVCFQWIGNLVTMSWWNDLWLKEGLSSLVMYLPLKDYYPEIEEVRNTILLKITKLIIKKVLILKKQEACTLLVH